MSKRYLRSTADTGKKAVKYWDEFYYRINDITLSNSKVTNFNASGLYKVSISWRFNSQEGYMYVELNKNSNQVTYTHNTTMGTTQNNSGLHTFEKTLAIYNDPSMSKLLDKIFNV